MVSMNSDQLVLGRLSVVQHKNWLVAIIYANKDHFLRHEIWQTVSNAHLHHGALLLGGGLNYIHSQNDKHGGKPFLWSEAIFELEEFMQLNDLHELEFVGPMYTWTNNKYNSSKIWIELDYILVNLAASIAVGDSRVTHLA